MRKSKNIIDSINSTEDIKINDETIKKKRETKVKDGKIVKKQSKSTISPPSRGGSSSSGSPDPKPTEILVSAITVTGADTVVNGKTLQMCVDITPTTDTNQKVTWSVTDGTG